MPSTKFTPETLKEIQEHVFKTYLKTPDRCRLAGMERDLTHGEILALVYFEASITVLNNMGAFKDDAMEHIVPEVYGKTNETIWGD